MKNKALLRGLHDTPFLVDPAYAEAVKDALVSGDETFFGDEREELQADMLEVVSDSGATKSLGAIVEVSGGLVHKPKHCSSLSSYQELRALHIGLANDPNVSTVATVFDTPGGMAYQCFETARAIREAMDATDTKWVGYVDGAYGAKSAGYALLSTCHEVICNPEAEVGGIGVVVEMVNTLPKKKAEGSEVVIVTYGDKKRPFSEDGTFTEEYKSKVSEKVNVLGRKFDTHVATFRSLPEEDIKSLQADSFPASKSLELGLIDRVMERSEFMSYINQLINTKETEKLSDEKLEAAEAKLTDYKVQLASTAEALEALSSQNAVLTEKLEASLREREDEKAIIAKEAISSKLASYAFIDNKEGMTETLFAMSEDSRKAMFSSFAAAASSVKVVDAVDKEKTEASSRQSVAVAQDEVPIESAHSYFQELMNTAGGDK